MNVFVDIQPQEESENRELPK
jgi:hypothetical protein